MRARDVMTTEVISVTPDATVGDIAAILIQHRISGVPVIEAGRLVGIVSEGDLNVTGASELQKLLNDNPWLQKRHVNLVVNKGVVHVWGIVRSQEHREALHTALRAIPGATAIEDHLSPNWFTSD